jgi:hypothetical protein
MINAVLHSTPLPCLLNNSIAREKTLKLGQV